MDIKRPRTIDEYLELVAQAIFEVEELRMSMEYDMEGMNGVDSFLEELEGDIRNLKQAMSDGSYQWANGDLPFMAIVERTSDRLLPFKYLLRQINYTHLNGLDTEGSDRQ